ncbi:MAG: GYF domain-containing protein [Schlesneria sp.]
MTRNECLEILELPSDASKDDIVKAFRQLAQVWHPDRFPNNVDLQQKANAKLAKINEAYQCLRDEKFTKEPKATNKQKSNEWFYTIDGEKKGPIKTSELVRLAASGILKPDDLVWKEGFPEWVPARQIKGLNEVFPRPKPSVETIDISTGPVTSFGQSKRSKFPAYIAGLMAMMIMVVLLLLWPGRKPKSTEPLVDRPPIQIQSHASKETLKDKGIVVSAIESPIQNHDAERRPRPIQRSNEVPVESVANENGQNAATEHEAMTAVARNVTNSDVTIPGDSATESTSESESQSMDTVSAKEADVTYLDDLKEVSFSTGYGILGKHGLTGYEPTDVQHIRLRSDPTNEVLHGLSLHPKGTISKALNQKGDPIAHVSYKLNKQYSVFRGAAALNFPSDEDRVKNASLKAKWTGKAETPIKFRVIGDSKVLWESRALQRHGDSQDCEIAIESVDYLRLEVTCEGAEQFAWSFWANPSVSKSKSLDHISTDDSVAPKGNESIPQKILEYFEREESNRTLLLRHVDQQLDDLNVKEKNASSKSIASIQKKQISQMQKARNSLKSLRKTCAPLPLPMEVGDIGFQEVLEQVSIWDKNTITAVLFDSSNQGDLLPEFSITTDNFDSLRGFVAGLQKNERLPSGGFRGVLNFYLKPNTSMKSDRIEAEARREFIVKNVDTAKISKSNRYQSGQLLFWPAKSFFKVVATKPDAFLLERFPELTRGRMAECVVLELVKTPSDIEKYRDMFYQMQKSEEAK